jgi:hypothetical protein
VLSWTTTGGGLRGERLETAASCLDVKFDLARQFHDGFGMMPVFQRAYLNGAHI